MKLHIVDIIVNYKRYHVANIVLHPVLTSCSHDVTVYQKTFKYLMSNFVETDFEPNEETKQSIRYSPCCIHF